MRYFVALGCLFSVLLVAFLYAFFEEPYAFFEELYAFFAVLAVIFWALLSYLVVRFYILPKIGNSNTSTKKQPATASRSETAARPKRVAKPTPKRQRKVAQPRLPDHAAAAVQQTGRKPNVSPVQLLDIGLLVYFNAASEPIVYRVRDIPEEAQAIQPFAILQFQEKAHGPISFDIYNSSDDLLFREEDEHQFIAGKNNCITKNYLRLRPEFEFSDRWCLRMYSDEHAIAYHYFEWRLPTVIQLGDDGEVSPEEQESFLESEVLEDMSLEQLMMGDDGEVSPEEQESFLESEEVNNISLNQLMK